MGEGWGVAGPGTSGYSRAENEQDYLPQQGRARHYWRGEENEDDNASIKVVLKNQINEQDSRWQGKDDAEIACIARRIRFPSIQMNLFTISEHQHISSTSLCREEDAGRTQPDEEHILPVGQPASQRITEEILPEGGGALPPPSSCKTQK